MTKGHCRTEPLCTANDNPVSEKHFSLVKAFVTGSFGGQTPVVEIDGRTIRSGEPGPMTRRIRDPYQALLATECPSASAESPLG